MLLLLSIVVYLIMYSLRIWMVMFQLHTNKFYYINCGVIQGFPALRKAKTTEVKKNVFFHECLMSPISCLHITRLLHHSVMLMNEWQSPHCCLSEFPQIMAAKKPKNPYCLQTVTFKLSQKGKKIKMRKGKMKVMCSVALVIMGRKSLCASWILMGLHVKPYQQYNKVAKFGRMEK